MSTDEVTMHIMGKACLCPGLATLLCNIISSSDIEASDSLDSWKKEYLSGIPVCLSICLFSHLHTVGLGH